MSKPVRDPKGNELKLILMQVMERSAHGDPTLCRVRYDHETLADAAQGIGENTFLMVWAPVNSVLGELRLDDLPNTLQTVQDELAAAKAEIEAAAHDNRSLRERLNKATAEIDEKTGALRELQRERDPARLEAMVEARTREIKDLADAVAARSAAHIEGLKRETEELRASKKKLREALDRAKDKR